VVAERRVNVGDRVENIGGGDPMFRLVDNRVLELTVTVPSARLGSIRIGQPLMFTADLAPARTFSGRVTSINPSVEEMTRSGRIVAAVTNADGALRAGLFVRGRIVGASREHVLQVPREALLNWDVAAQSAELFVVVDGHAQKWRVRTGAVGDRLVEIVDALSAGEPVITRGGFALGQGDAVNVAKRAPGSTRLPAYATWARRRGRASRRSSSNSSSR
jgi:RND family efflux transporter MFP subunit